MGVKLPGNLTFTAHMCDPVWVLGVNNQNILLSSWYVPKHFLRACINAPQVAKQCLPWVYSALSKDRLSTACYSWIVSCSTPLILISQKKFEKTFYLFYIPFISVRFQPSASTAQKGFRLHQRHGNSSLQNFVLQTIALFFLLSWFNFSIQSLSINRFHFIRVECSNGCLTAR